MNRVIVYVPFLLLGLAVSFVGPIPLSSQSLQDTSRENREAHPYPGLSRPQGSSYSADGSMSDEVLAVSGQGIGGESLDALEDALANDGQMIVEPEHKRNGMKHFLSSFKLPEHLEFAGQRVPLDTWYVRERIEYEFYQFLAAEGDSIIIAKRTGRCFPLVEKKLAEAGLPDDLKYMLLVESKCVAAAYSRARASGPWQFINSTGKRFKLRSNKWRDERRNLELSTNAAIKYLRHLRQVTGDWFLGMAAYNAGEANIKKHLKAQKVDDYWNLHYVRETMRYVPRIIAAKEIFSQPEKYLGLTKEDLYTPVETKTVSVRVRKSKEHLASIAERNGTYYLELKMLNPELRRAYLPRGTYTLKVPVQDCSGSCVQQAISP